MHYSIKLIKISTDFGVFWAEIHENPKTRLEIIDLIQSRGFVHSPLHEVTPQHLRLIQKYLILIHNVYPRVYLKDLIIA